MSQCFVRIQISESFIIHGKETVFRNLKYLSYSLASFSSFNQSSKYLSSTHLASYLRFVMWQPVQRSAIKDIIPVERSLRILAKWVTPVAHLQRFLATIRVRALSSTADRVPANLPNNFLYLLNQNVMLLRLNESSWHRNRHKPFHRVRKMHIYSPEYIIITNC